LAFSGLQAVVSIRLARVEADTRKPFNRERKRRSSFMSNRARKTSSALA
jgi:hypothetical protein